MNNNALGTLAGLQKAHYDTTYGTVLAVEVSEPNLQIDYANIAKAYNIDGIHIDLAHIFYLVYKPP